MPSKTILALDQSSQITGYAVFTDGALVQSGVFSFDDGHVGKRLVKIRKKVIQLIEEYKPDMLAFEDIQLQAQKNPATYKILAQVLGVLEELATELKIEYVVVHSTSWKSTLKIKGRARAEQKKNAQDYVANTYNKKVTQDESDAICIGTHVVKTQESAF